MKNSVKSFDGFKDVLNRNEMKNILGGMAPGGITCTGTKYGITTTGACSGSSVSACEGYARNQGYTNVSCSAGAQ